MNEKSKNIILELDNDLGYITLNITDEDNDLKTFENCLEIIEKYKLKKNFFKELWYKYSNGNLYLFKKNIQILKENNYTEKEFKDYLNSSNFNPSYNLKTFKLKYKQKQTH